jgi:hypothetical protein
MAIYLKIIELILCKYIKKTESNTRWAVHWLTAVPHDSTPMREVYGHLEILSNQRVIHYLVCLWISKQRNIQGVPGGMCQTSGGCSLC